ncbi:MAG: flagellin protein [Chlamydiales bacterium]|jgi:flagellin|nr:flagellin protein [Chlamydiales bacterium]
MIIANNGTPKMFVSNYNQQNSKLQAAMTRLSTNQRMITPGDAPADLGISERFRSQIRNSEEASRVIQNAVNMFQTTDTYLQEVHNILDRMGELAVASADGSKSQADRKNLDLEFQQLKMEISRISESGKYNGIDICGKTSVAVYDTLAHEIVFTQSDGSSEQSLGLNFRDGNTSRNGINYSFESSASNGFVGDYLFSKDGKSLIYVAQKTSGTVTGQQTLMRLDLQSNNITTVDLTTSCGASANSQSRLVMDEKGRIWVSDPSTAGAATAASANFNVNLFVTDSMTLDGGGNGATNKWAGGVSLASSFTKFSVNQDYIYYIGRSGGAATGKLMYIKQNIYNSNDKQTLLYDLSGTTFDLNSAEHYSVSADGQYIAYESSTTAGKLTVINTATGNTASLQAGTRTNSIVGMGFDANNNLYWTDTGNTGDANAIKKVGITYGEKPVFSEVTTLRHGTAGRFGANSSAMAAYGMGISVSGGSPAAMYEFQVGPDSGMTVSFESADVRLIQLGLSSLDVLTADGAQEAIKAVGKAVDNVANQRALLGSQISRLGFIQETNDGYRNNLTISESRIRDVDIAQETTNMTAAQMAAQVSVSMLAQANSARQNILRLLQ